MKKFLLFENILSWNRKSHIFVGLFILLFILFFSLTGLLLNHSQWEFASFWKERKEAEIISPVTIPENLDSISVLQHFMKQLNLSGEVSNVKKTPESFNFMVMKPGTNQDIQVDFKSGISVRKEVVLNWWGKIRNLHTFNGTDMALPDVRPNWIVTRIWRLAMDSIAISLIFLCISGWLMWYTIRKSYPFGLLVLILGILGAIFFVFV